MLEIEQKVRGTIKFGLGQIVVSRKTGFPRTGIIVAISLGGFIKYGYDLQGFTPIAWNKLFPDWENKPVYTLYCDDKCKHMTLDELREYYPELSEYELQEKYDALPYALYTNFCEDDLETVDGETI